MNALSRPSDQLERAWYLLTVLIRLGRPAHPLELDSSPDLVESLCQIPGSPLFLRDDQFVTVSQTAIKRFSRFLSRLFVPFVPRSEIRVSEQSWRRWGDVAVMHLVKRKGRDDEDEYVMCKRSVKRRLLVDSVESLEKSKEDEGQCNSLVAVHGSEDLTKEVHLGVPEILQNFLIPHPLIFPSEEILTIKDKETEAFCTSEIQSVVQNSTALQLTTVDETKELNTEFNQLFLPNPEECNLELSLVQKSTEPGLAFEEKNLVSEQKFTEGIRESLDNQRDTKPSKKGKEKISKGKLKRNNLTNKNFNIVKVQGKHNAKDTNGSVGPKLPNFESFIIEEEEGSGGYGTVYKARRKTDGKIFALKYPHTNAPSHHVYNEMKMLERFGGRNYVIRYEGSFKSGKSECFVLEHVEHDRPEVLKKAIDVFDIQWYGYCMFRALASLHKQGIVHRDVKPGNFLFSRKLAKGYLIDFNLATDLHQMFLRSNAVSLSALNSTLAISKKKRLNRSPSKMVAPDASGVTSAKDQTSTKTPNLVRSKKQVIDYHVIRKEIANIAQEIMLSPQLINDDNSNNNKVVSPPLSHRKRVEAPLAKADSKLIVFTPMPLYSGGNAVAGSGVFKSKGDGKHKREGACVGTKGFRAPEVLFKSFHQSCKMDVWSAGVTLLYLIIGKSPFGGDPEQNIKEIAKLRGSEDLWEVAKLHNCESSFPSELFDVQSLQSLDLRNWCAANTRKPEFLKLIPESLFDLVDKCLTVNPRRRISADEALAHNFFDPCRNSLRKQRTQRKSTSQSQQLTPLSQ